ncbi:hypothetical protein PAEPH01_0112 [Pancytospora epiphaga]|nr:hypothetical protein PAEPH01_0112 [Pancytospora epiphaga]
MDIDELLLSDYGTIPQKVGLFLLRKNASSLESIRVGTGLENDALRDGVSFLIQRRLVNFFIFERNIRYFIDREILRKRIYFPLYVKYVSDNFSSEHLEVFTRILAAGIVKVLGGDKIVEELVDSGVLMANTSSHSRTALSHSFSGGIPVDNVDKRRKMVGSYFVVDYARLGLRIAETAAEGYLKKRYNDAAVEVYRAVLKCTHINKVNIIKNLSTTKILLVDNGAIINDKNNINDYISYLCASKVLIKGVDADKAFVLNTDPTYLKLYVIGLMIKDPACRRLFNLISQGGAIDDKTLTMNALLSINTIREKILTMQRGGLLQQRCIDEYKGTHRIEHSWAVDLSSTCKQLMMKIEDLICGKLRQFNECWDVNYYMGSSDMNDSVWVSDLISLGMDHLVLGLE